MELNENIMLAANDFIKDAVIIGQPSNSLADFPLTNFQTPQQYEFGRFWSAYTGQTFVIFDLGGAKAIDVVAAIKHNMGQMALWRVRISNDITFAGVEYDSGWKDVTPPTTGMGGLQWGSFDWGGIAPLSIANSFNRNAILPLGNTYIGRYIRFDFNDEAEVFSRVDSYVQMARLWASSGYQPSLNVDYGAKAILIDETGVKVARSGARQYNERNVRRRALSLSFPELPHLELLYNIFGPIYMQNGKRGELLCILFPLQPETFAMEAVYGNLKDVEPATHVYFNHTETSMYVEESP